METSRRSGVADEVCAASLADDFPADVVWTTAANEFAPYDVLIFENSDQMPNQDGSGHRQQHP